MVEGPATHLPGSRIPAGTRLNGIYEIDHLIGFGGMGEIYKGHAIQTGDPVAIKLMLPELAENESALALFRKEASALHSLQHEAIVRYYVFTIEPILQRPYLAMEFVDGRSLSAILQDDGPLSLEAVHVLMQRIATGLQAAHERGIIHRDVTPDNIIVPGGNVGSAKIIDFGIARSTQLSEATVIGSGFAGKYNYVSPEQLGLFGGDVSAKSDIYSLGLVLVQALTGRALDMDGTQFQVVEKRRKVPDLAGIDMRIRPLLERMLQPQPERRPESMAAVAASTLSSSGFLRSLKPDAISPAADGVRLGPTGGTRSWRYAAVGVALTAVFAGLGATYYYHDALMPFFTSSKTMTKQTGLEPGGGATQTGQPPLSPASRIEKIKRYVEQYDGGDCFFLTPIAIGETRATIEGLGASAEPFTKLDAAFQRANGFEADISVRQVTVPQCPAVTFLGRLRDERSRAPRLTIDNVNLRNGDTLTGLVDRFGSRNIELLLVSDGGAVRNVSQQLKPGTDAKTFSLAIQDSQGAPGSQPQLLVAVASPGALDALRVPRPVTADQFFPAVLNDAQRSGQALGVTARYFKVER
jgi:hypothetical protein